MVKSLIWNCAGLFKVALRIWLCIVCTHCVHLVLRPRGDMSTKMGTKMKTKLHVCLYFQPNFAYQAWDWAKSKLFNLIYNMKCLFPTSICDSVLIQFNYAAVDGLTDICYHLLPNSCPIPKSGSPTHSQVSQYSQVGVAAFCQKTVAAALILCREKNLRPVPRLPLLIILILLSAQISNFSYLD